jgi:hypothetical protein
MAGNCFDVTPFEKGNADYAYAQLRCATPEGSIDGHFPGHFLHDILARHCVNARASDTGLSVHMRRLYAALGCVAYLKYQPHCYGEVLNQLCYITAALGYRRDPALARKFLSPNHIDLVGWRTYGARLNHHNAESTYLSSLTQGSGDTSTHYMISFKDIRAAARSGVIVKPKPSDIQSILKKLAAYLPSTVYVKTGADKNAQPKMATYTTRSGKRFVEFVDADTWSMLLNTVRQLPDRPACYPESMVSIRSVYSRLHELRSRFATWAFAQPDDFAETMREYDKTVTTYFRSKWSLAVSPCPAFWQSHCDEIIAANGQLPPVVSLEDVVFAR